MNRKKHFSPSLIAIAISVLIISFSSVYLVYGSPGITTIGSDISTTNLRVSGSATTTGNQVVSGELTVTGTSTFSGNIGIGTAAPNNLLSVYDLIDFDNTDLNTKLGYQAGKNIVTGTQYNTYVGYQAGMTNSTASTNAADYNTAVGYQALYKNTTGSANSTMGMWTLSNNTTGSSNTAMGSSLYKNTTGSANSAVGNASLTANTTGSYNSAMGSKALYSLKPTSKAITGFADYSGTVAGTVLATSTAHGLSAGTTAGVGIYGTTNYNGVYTVTYIDTNSFYFTDTWVSDDATGWWGIDAQGKNNTALGYYAGYNEITGSSNVFLGYYAGAYETGSNAFYVDNQNRTNTAGDKANALMYGTFAAASANQNLTVNAHLNVTGTSTFTGISTFAGNVGIGTTTPSSLLDIYSTATTTLEIDSGSVTKGACLKLKGSDGSGYTYCTVNDGLMNCTTTSCE